MNIPIHYVLTENKIDVDSVLSHAPTTITQTIKSVMRTEREKGSSLATFVNALLDVNYRQ